MTTPTSPSPKNQLDGTEETPEIDTAATAAEVPEAEVPEAPVVAADDPTVKDAPTDSDVADSGEKASPETGEKTSEQSTAQAADSAKVVQVKPTDQAGPGRPGRSGGLVGRPGIKVKGASGPGGLGLRRQPLPDRAANRLNKDATAPLIPAAKRETAGKNAPLETVATPSQEGGKTGQGRNSNGGGGKGKGKGGDDKGGGKGNRSPDDVNERAARRAAALAEQDNQESGAAGANTLPVPRPEGPPPAKQGKGQGKGQGLAKAKAKAEKPKVVVVQSTVQPAKIRGRHWVTLLSFLLMVALPAAVAGWYLWNRAADQYASSVGFSVRTEEVGSSIEILGVPTDLSGSSTSDTDILYEFLQGQELVAAIDADLDLRAIWSKADPDIDPIFAYHPPGTIEDLTAHWARMVKIYYDPGTGLIDLRVLAFDPLDATAIATQIRDRSSAMINKLSAIARADAIGYARDELTQAEDRLREARVEIQGFRNRTQLIDPTMQTQAQSGLIGALEGQLADTQIELRLLQETARANDPRIRQVELKIEVIEAQIAEERSELGLEGVDDNISVADLVGEYEALVVDLEFAQQAYTTALATFVSARNEARRQSRYLAAHVNPTKAEKSQYPDRIQIMVLLCMLLLLIWSVVVLTGYALRDRR